MPEDIFGLTAGSVRVLNAMAAKHRQRLPDAGRRTRRVWPTDDSTTTTGTTDDGCCADCVCMSDLTITDCSAVPCLDSGYVIIVDEINAIFNEVELAHDSGCVYSSDSFNVTVCGVDYGSYYWVLTIDAGIDTCVLELVSTTSLQTNLHVVYHNKWHFDGACGNRFGVIPNCSVLEDVKVLLPCEVCIAPAGQACVPCPPPVPSNCCPYDPLPDTLYFDLVSDGALFGCPEINGLTITLHFVSSSLGITTWQSNPWTTPSGCQLMVTTTLEAQIDGTCRFFVKVHGASGPISDPCSSMASLGDIDCPFTSIAVLGGIWNAGNNECGCCLNLGGTTGTIYV